MRYAVAGALASGPLWITLGWMIGTGWLTTNWPEAVLGLLFVGAVAVLLDDAMGLYESAKARQGKHCRGVRVCDLAEELRRTGHPS